MSVSLSTSFFVVTIESLRLQSVNPSGEVLYILNSKGSDKVESVLKGRVGLKTT
jgi:hypothetical protein